MQVLLPLSFLKDNKSMRLELVIGVVLVCWSGAGQTTTVSIDAISPCEMTFTVDAVSGANLMSGCISHLPGANVTAVDWPTCFMMCCPGLPRPATSTFNDVQSCVSTYAEKPFLVTLIGIILGVLLLLIFICIPCFCTKEGTFYWIKRSIKERCCPDRKPEEFAEDLSPTRRHHHHQTKSYELKSGEQGASNSRLQEEPIRISISDELIDEVPSEERLCVVCGEGKANLRLNCRHHFHSQCLGEGELQKCRECSSEKVLPVRAYCCVCERRYSHLNQVESTHQFICRTCEEK